MESNVEAQLEHLRNADIAETWRRSPLKRDAIARVFDAAGAPLLTEGPAIEAAYLTLARCLYLALGVSMGRQEPPRKAKMSAVKAYGDLLDALTPLLHAPGAPPMPSVEWLEAMGEWADATITSSPRRGPPKKEFHRFSVPLFLALYEIVLGQKPAATIGGPTERFLTAIYQEMKPVIAGSTFTPPEGGVMARAGWAQPTSAALLMQIRTFAAAASEKIKLVDYWLHEFYQALLKNSEPPTHH